MTMLEKAARALVERRYPGSMAASHAENGLTIVPPDIWFGAQDEVRAVLEAIRAVDEEFYHEHLDRLKEGDTAAFGHVIGLILEDKP